MDVYHPVSPILKRSDNLLTLIVLDIPLIIIRIVIMTSNHFEMSFMMAVKGAVYVI